MTSEAAEILSQILEVAIEEANLIIKVLTSRKLSFKEIAKIAGSIDKASELILTLYWWRMLIPKASSTLSWTTCSPKLSLDEEYEVPPCISYAIAELVKKHYWSYKVAIERYLDSIGEVHKETIIDSIDEILSTTIYKFYVKASTISHALTNRGLNEKDVNRVIAELKGGGVISPSIQLAILLKIQEPIYELNKALFIKKLKNN